LLLQGVGSKQAACSTTSGFQGNTTINHALHADNG
jgi:hypothetical protein